MDDPALTVEPLARPGEVVKRLRGTAAEQLAALPPDRPKPTPVKTPKAKASKAKPTPKRPRPDRAALDKTEQALADAIARQRHEDEALAAEERALAKRRRAQRTAHAAETAVLERTRACAAGAYEAAMEKWRAG